MIKYLQGLKAKRGFTLIEMIVVIAIIAVLSAIILPNISGDSQKIRSANSAARDFYVALQMVMSKFSLYDGKLSPAYIDNPELGIIKHYPKMGGNYPYDKSGGDDGGEYPAWTWMYVMLEAKNGQIKNVGVVTDKRGTSSSSDPLYTLLQRNAADRNTEFGRLLKNEIDGQVSFRDGFYYGRVEFNTPFGDDGKVNQAELPNVTVTVAYTAYTGKELPKATGSKTEYTNNNLYFGKNNKLKSGEICGICAAKDRTLSSAGMLGDQGTYLR